MPASLILGVAGMRQFIANRFPRPLVSTTTVALLVALYIALAENRLFWRSFIARLGLNTFEHWAFLFTVGLAFALLLNVFLSLFAFRPVFKPFLYSYCWPRPPSAISLTPSALSSTGR
jgi:hypothetical protein